MMVTRSVTSRYQWMASSNTQCSSSLQHTMMHTDTLGDYIGRGVYYRYSVVGHYVIPGGLRPAAALVVSVVTCIPLVTH
jgi:hypothetical protein